MLQTETLSRYARLSLARKRLKAKYEELGAELEAIEQTLIQHMIQEGTTKITVNGASISIETKIWPKLLRPRDEVVQALEQVGLGDLVQKNFNTNKLAAYIRELDAAGEDIPAPLRPYIAKNPVDSLVVRKK